VDARKGFVYGAVDLLFRVARAQEVRLDVVWDGDRHLLDHHRHLEDGVVAELDRDYRVGYEKLEDLGADGPLEAG
jgi:hypothetical protein